MLSTLERNLQMLTVLSLEAVKMLVELKAIALTEAEWARISPTESQDSVDHRRKTPPRHPEMTRR